MGQRVLKCCKDDELGAALDAWEAAEGDVERVVSAGMGGDVFDSDTSLHSDIPLPPGTVVVAVAVPFRSNPDSER